MRRKVTLEFTNDQGQPVEVSEETFHQWAVSYYSESARRAMCEDKSHGNTTGWSAALHVRLYDRVREFQRVATQASSALDVERASAYDRVLTEMRACWPELARR